MREIQIVDSHTGGEPTRVVVAGGPDLGAGSLNDRIQRFAHEHDRFRSAVVNEPRGSDALVGALLCEPHVSDCAAGVIFFNNVGYLGMCGHGTIGLVAVLEHLGRIETGVYRIDTPVGVISAENHGGGEVTVLNVPSYRYAHQVEVEVEGYGPVRGDVAWGGNWFFLVQASPAPLTLAHVDVLTAFAWKVREALRREGIAGRDAQEIDHIELFGPPSGPHADSRNFVLCPGKSYDRSPCGTGTSAKVACLAADGKLRPGQTYRQESIVGSVFHATYRWQDGLLRPSIRGSAFINAESRLLLDDRDPFCWGIRA